MLVAMRAGETPVPIPNTTVKTGTADGTAQAGEQVAASIKRGKTPAVRRAFTYMREPVSA